MPKKYREAILFIAFSSVAIILGMMTGQATATPPVDLTPNSYLTVAFRPENTPTYTPAANQDTYSNPYDRTYEYFCSNQYTHP